MTPKLTIIPGLRFELEDGLVEKHNQLIVGWNPTADLPSISGPANTAYAATLAAATAAELAVLPASLTIQGGPIYAGVNGNPRTGYANSYRVLPRFGGTYQVNRRVVIRAGFGLYFDTMDALQPQDNQSGFSASTSASSSSTYGTNFARHFAPVQPISRQMRAERISIRRSAAAREPWNSWAPVLPSMITTSPRRGNIAARSGRRIQFGASTMLDVSFNIARTTHVVDQQKRCVHTAVVLHRRPAAKHRYQHVAGPIASQPFLHREFQQPCHQQSGGVQHHVAQPPNTPPRPSRLATWCAPIRR